MEIRIFHEVLANALGISKISATNKRLFKSLPFSDDAWARNHCSLVRNGRKTMVLVAGDCDIDKKVRIYIARNSILFELSNFANKSESGSSRRGNYGKVRRSYRTGS